MAADGDSGHARFRVSVNGGLVEPPPNFRDAHDAAWKLALERPEDCARDVLRHASLACRAVLLVSLSAVAASAAFGMSSLLAGLGLLFAGLILVRIALFVAGLTAGRREQGRIEATDLPLYSILIALKDEAAVTPGLALALGAIDYPSGRLDVKLLVEADDLDTQAALRAQCWPAGTSLVIVPPGTPQTKPRALNYGLATARGEFVVVYDAEDWPAAGQLRAAVAAFASGGPRLGCVQAPLVGQGPAMSWIAGQWSLEYAVQFGALMPGLARLGLPMALGGTSNHFRTAALRAAGGWDPWNVTEDADLGFRLARQGWRVGVIHAPTLEAPPARFGVWLAQRSRWLKGFLQTWLVLMRRPRRSWRELGPAGFLTMQATLGGAILAALVHGPWALWALACAASPGLNLGPFWTTLAVSGYVAGIALALAAPGRLTAGRVFLALTQPAYWPLHTLAMARAIYGLVRCPHFWAKTPHAPCPPSASCAAASSLGGSYRQA